MATLEDRLKGVPHRLVVLAACGFVRTVEHLLIDKRSKDALETTERFVDGMATEQEVKAATDAVTSAFAALEVAASPADVAARAREAVEAAWAASWAASPAEGVRAAVSQLHPHSQYLSGVTRIARSISIARSTWASTPAQAVKELEAAVEVEARAAEAEARAVENAGLAAFGAVYAANDPTRAVGFAQSVADLAAKAVGYAEAANKAHQSILDCILPPRNQFFLPAHVKGLAITIYDNRDWSLMAILADALEEIGLEDLAQHCRQPIHAKGCHVLDSILGLH